MPVQFQGPSGTIAQVENNTQAVRVVVHPLDVAALGSYALSATSGTIAAGIAANAPVYSFRWTQSTSYALIRKVTIAMAALASGFTAGIGNIGMIVARSFSASDSGGTSILPTTNSQKRKTAFGTTLATDIRIASTGTLTAGTRTLDGADLFNQVFGILATVQTVYQASTPLWSPDFSGEWPLILAQNEGFIVRAVSIPATGTWQITVAIEWSEITSAGSGF